MFIMAVPLRKKGLFLHFHFFIFNGDAPTTIKLKVGGGAGLRT